VSMTEQDFDENDEFACFNLTGSCFEFDNPVSSTVFVSNVNISGYASLGSDNPRAFLGDLSTGELHNINTHHLRVECGNPGDKFAVFSSSGVKSFIVDSTTFADSGVPKSAIVQFTNSAGGVGEGSVINLHPGDYQKEYPGGTSPIDVITCAGVSDGLVIYSYNKYGGGSTLNGCSGAIVIPGAASIWSVDAGGNFRAAGVFSATYGKACSPANVTLSSAWGSGATAKTFSGYSQTCQFTIKTGSGSFSSAPILTFTFPNPFPVTPICELNVHAISGPGGAIMFNNTTQSATSPIFTATTSTGSAFTPTDAEAYTVVLRCGP
jgi:hypothetical protein